MKHTLKIIAALTAVGCAQQDNTRVEETANGSIAAAALDTSHVTGTIRFSVAPSGNTARYRVREQLMGRDLPNDAVGETPQVSGGITIDSTGAVIKAQSRFTVSTGTLKSDSDRRDGYVRGRILESEKFPTVELSPTSLRGLPAGALATNTSGPITFELLADLTVRGVTKPTTWRVTARQTNGQVAGTASTRFTFADFGLTPPKVPILLSVADTIGLEYDFALTRD